jgi:hypothetical protein
MAGARMSHVFAQHPFEHAMQRLTLGSLTSRVLRRGSSMEQRVGVEREDLEVVRILIGHLAHRLGVGALLIHALGGVEALDVAHRDRVDQRAFHGVGAVAEFLRFLAAA